MWAQGSAVCGVSASVEMIVQKLAGMASAIAGLALCTPVVVILWKARSPRIMYQWLRSLSSASFGPVTLSGAETNAVLICGTLAGIGFFVLGMFMLSSSKSDDSQERG